MAELTSPFTAGPGGVMTDDVGVITGDLELRTICTPDRTVQVLVRYIGAEEWYHIGAAEVTLHDENDHEPLHKALLAILHRPEG